MKKLLTALLVLAVALSFCSIASARSIYDTFNILADTDTVFVGDTLQLSMEDTTGTLDMTGIIYSVSNKNAQVTQDGLFTALRDGSVTISATTADKKHHDTLKIRILARPESVEVTGGKDILAAGKKITLSTKMLPKSVSNKKVTWSSSDETIATISEKGHVVAIAPGEVTFTASSVLDPKISGSFTMQVIRLASRIDFAQTDPTVKVKETVKLSLKFEPQDVSLRDVTFSSNRPKIATVDENGVVTGVKAGKATIKAKAKDGSGKTATVVVYVTQPVEGMHFSKNELRIGVGSYSTVTAVLEPKDSSNKKMTWYSDDESIATIKGDTNKVRVYAHAWGDTTITGVTEDGGYTAKMVIHGGSFARAIRIRESRVKSNGRISLVFENVSNLDITQVRFTMRLTKSPPPGQAGLAAPIEIDGKYNNPIYPGERTVHGQFSFKHPAIDSGYTCETAITGITTASGFKYNIGESRWKFVATN